MKIYPKFNIDEVIKHDKDFIVDTICIHISTIFDSIKNKFQNVNINYILRELPSKAIVIKVKESELKLTDLFVGISEKVRSTQGRTDFLNAIDRRNIFYEIQAKDYTRDDFDEKPEMPDIYKKFDLQLGQIVTTKENKNQYQIISIEIDQLVNITKDNYELSYIKLDTDKIFYNLFPMTEGLDEVRVTRDQIRQLVTEEIAEDDKPDFEGYGLHGLDDDIDEDIKKEELTKIKIMEDKRSIEIDMFNLMKFAKPTLEFCIEGDLPGTFDTVGQARILRKVNAGKDMPFEYFDIQDGKILVKLK